MSLASIHSMHALLLCGFKTVPIQFFNCGYSLTSYDHLSELKSDSSSHNSQSVIVIRAPELNDQMLKEIYSLNSTFKSARVIVMTSMGNVGFSILNPRKDTLFFYSEDDIGGVKALILMLRDKSVAFKRRHVRAPVDINATVITETVIHSQAGGRLNSPPSRATVCDLSMSGAGLLVEGADYEKDQYITVTFILSARDRKEFTGQIKWSHKVGQSHYRLGIEFIEAA